MKPVLADDFIRVMERSGEIARLLMAEQVTDEHLFLALVRESEKDKKLRRQIVRSKIPLPEINRAIPYSPEVKDAINRAIAFSRPGNEVTALHLLRGYGGK